MKPILQHQFTQAPGESKQTLQWDSSFQAVATEFSTPQAPLFTLLEKPHVFNGFINGYRQPVGLIKLQVISLNTLQIQHLQKALTYYFGKNVSDLKDDLIACLGAGVCALQKAAGIPLFQSIQIDRLSEEDNVYSLWIPTLHEECFHQAMAFMLQFCYQHTATTLFIPNSALSREIDEVILALKSYAPTGSNSLRLLQAAFNEGIPWVYVAQNTFQYGYGCYSRWFDSSFTDKTSKIAVEIARDKRSTLMLLQKTGLPVTRQIMVHSEAHAVENAHRMGYPVVIKPDNQDGGLGVFPRITSDEQLKKAYGKAQRYSKTILLEKHIFGKDYRLIVLNGELIWAIERFPAGVTGDGTSNISELIQVANQSRAIKIEITEELLAYLSEQRLELNSIPNAGIFIPLNKIANISAGGTPVAVFDKVHPDNRRLAETAAKLLRLDLAGIDFITPNIEESYLEKGGSLIEINGQPQLGIITTPHIYRQVLNTLIPKQGRIPIIVICGESAGRGSVQTLMALLASDYKHIGLAKGNSAFLNNEQLCHAPSLFNAGQLLLLNQQVELLIYCLDSGEAIEHQELPFDQHDFIVFPDALHCKNEDSKLSKQLKTFYGANTERLSEFNVEFS